MELEERIINDYRKGLSIKSLVSQAFYDRKQNDKTYKKEDADKEVRQIIYKWYMKNVLGR